MPGALAVSILLSAALAATPERGDPPALVPRLELSGAHGTSLALAPVLADDPQEPGPAPAAAPDAERARRLRGWGRALRWSTAGALVVTSTLGTMAAIDQPTAFGNGRCITGNPVLGQYGCDRGLSTLHGSSAVLSVTLYTANAVLGLAAPESRGQVAESVRPLHRALSWVHLGGIIVQPLLGLIAAYPQVIGKSRTVPTDRLPKDLRTAHIFVGYVTTAAFLTTTALER